MAKILYDLKKNMNTASKAYGKWFGRTKSLETLNTRRLAQHIAEHGSIYTPDVVYGVLEKIDGLGTFYTTLESAGAAKKEDYNVQEHIKGLHIRFLPGQEQEVNLSSRQFLKKAEFISIDSLNAKSKGDGDDPPEP